MAGYVSYTSLRDSMYRDSVAAWRKAQLDTVRRAVAEGRWLQLKNISYAYDWNLALVSSPGLAPAEAYVTVTYLAETYGLDKCVGTFMAVSHSASVETAVSLNFGLSMDELEAAVQGWLNSQ